METANWIGIKDGHTSQIHAQAAIEAYSSKTDESISARSDPMRQVRHLDVDEVLARSLPKVVSE